MPAKKVAHINQYVIACECGQVHTIPAEKMSSYYSQGCGSCGYGSCTNYSYECPVKKKYISFSEGDV